MFYKSELQHESITIQTPLVGGGGGGGGEGAGGGKEIRVYAKTHTQKLSSISITWLGLRFLERTYPAMTANSNVTLQLLVILTDMDRSTRWCEPISVKSGQIHNYIDKSSVNSLHSATPQSWSKPWDDCMQSEDFFTTSSDLRFTSLADRAFGNNGLYKDVNLVNLDSK